MNFCVYITIYDGNQLPPFYIGHTTVDKVKNKYHGSVSSQRYKTTWDSELKRFPHLFRTIIVAEFTNRKDAILREQELQEKLHVVNNPLYINMSSLLHFNNEEGYSKS